MFRKQGSTTVSFAETGLSQRSKKFTCQKIVIVKTCLYLTRVTWDGFIEWNATKERTLPGRLIYGFDDQMLIQRFPFARLTSYHNWGTTIGSFCSITASMYHCYVVAERCQVDSRIFISSFFQPNYTDTCWHIPDFLVKKDLLSIAWSLAMIMTRWLAVSECHNRGFSSDCSA